MFIATLPSGPFETNAYVVACPLTQKAAIIDPGVDSFSKIKEVLENNHFIPTMILLTHSHWDHIAGVAELKQHYSIPVYVHPDDHGNLLNPRSDGLPCPYHFPGVTADHLFKDKETITLGSLPFEIIETPGHTPGGVCFYFPSEKVLFSGDTLFHGSIGNLSFPTSRPELMWPSLKKLALLPPETVVYPGHGPTTTIGHERWLANAEKIFGNY